MVILLVVLAAILLSVIVAIRASAFRKLKKQTQLIVLQSHEIQKQMRELELKNEKLNDLNKEKQQIIGLVSHDLKGPFNRIFALIQLMSLASENMTPEQKEYLGKIHQIVADGLSMVRNMIDNQKLEDIGIDLIPEPVNLTALVSPLINTYRTLSEKKRIGIHFEAPQLVPVTVDKVYMTRVIDNLLSNALKFSVPGSNISVTLRQTERVAEIAVNDEGPGISEEDQMKLFRKYQRLTARPTSGESSTGLGLYIVKTIIDKMEGDLVCESDGRTGTCFIVRLKKVN